MVRGGIVLLNRAFQLMREGRSREDAIIQAGRDRLRPIILVTLLLTPLLYVHFDNLKRGAVVFWRNAVPA